MRRPLIGLPDSSSGKPTSLNIKTEMTYAGQTEPTATPGQEPHRLPDGHVLSDVVSFFRELPSQSASLPVKSILEDQYSQHLQIPTAVLSYLSGIPSHSATLPVVSIIGHALARTPPLNTLQMGGGISRLWWIVPACFASKVSRSSTCQYCWTG